ncbi:MAG: hypothetical protein HWE27_18855 [Gammaproteobacteria bacterium]|nr:hypothetical protein [Gammaproteobacteria bacterium]
MTQHETKKSMRFFKKTSIALLAFSTLPVIAKDWSTNVGMNSEYIFRGVQQTLGASAFAGADYEKDGFYAGTWAADVGDGLEVDLYAGYNFALDKDIELGVGFTSYQYTGDFDSEYNEVNVNFGITDFLIEAAIGSRSEDVDLGIPEQDYTYFAVSYNYNDFTAKYGAWTQDIEGSYFEFSYGFQVAELDSSIALIISDDDLGDDEALVYTLSKSF